jgi:hypothetical protein
LTSALSAATAAAGKVDAAKLSPATMMSASPASKTASPSPTKAGAATPAPKKS